VINVGRSDNRIWLCSGVKIAIEGSYGYEMG